jgi:hypothetical protein
VRTTDCIGDGYVIIDRWVVVTLAEGTFCSTPEGFLSHAIYRVIILPGHLCLACTLGSLTRTCREVFSMTQLIVAAIWCTMSGLGVQVLL